jgi:uncharacterized membrane protein
MFQFLFILHLLAFGSAMGATVGNFSAMMLMQQSPGDAPALRKLPPLLARVGQVALAVLWVTGPLMIWIKFGGVEGLDWTFWAKIVCVLLLTGLVIYSSLLLRRMRAGDMSVAAQFPLIGRVGAGLLLLVVIFAVLAFG